MGYDDRVPASLQDAIDDTLRLMVGPDLAANDADDSWRRYQVPYPPARRGRFALERYVIGQGAPDRLHRVFKEGPERDTGWGDFCRLIEGPDLDSAPVAWCDPCQALTHHWVTGNMSYCQECDPPPGDRRQIWMSDTRAEILEHADLFSRVGQLGGADGSRRVLINGLGLGVAVHGVLTHPAVGHVDVVEINADVAALVGEFLPAGKVDVHVADAYTITWPAGTRWDVAWHDIWPEISDENLPGMRSLHRKYRKLAGWQGSWQRASCEQMGRLIRRAKAGHIHGEERELLLSGQFHMQRTAERVFPGASPGEARAKLDAVLAKLAGEVNGESK